MLYRAALLLVSMAILPVAAEEPQPTPAEPPVDEPEVVATTLRLFVDVAGAVDPLVRFKTRTGHLVVRVDGEVVVDRSERKTAADEPVIDATLGPGEHVIELRWEVTFRSATDRHHPMGTEPEPMGFSVPETGYASHVVFLESGQRLDVTARLFRKASVGIQGKSWVEWQP